MLHSPRISSPHYKMRVFPKEQYKAGIYCLFKGKESFELETLPCDLTHKLLLVCNILKTRIFLFSQILKF